MLIEASVICHQEVGRQKVIILIGLDNFLRDKFLEVIFEFGSKMSINGVSFNREHFEDNNLPERAKDFLHRRMLINLFFNFEDSHGDNVFPSKRKHEGQGMSKHACIFNNI